MTANAELYCKFKVPFVMGTTGGDRQLLYKTVQDSNVYSVISPQMGKQVIPMLQSPFCFSIFSIFLEEMVSSYHVHLIGNMKVPLNPFMVVFSECSYNYLRI